jgi:dihydropteroate synthase
MGVVNVTPDSFSDGGRWFSAQAAVKHGVQLLEDGADLVDVGGESTRPGAERPGVREELSRVVPVITGLVRAGAVVCVDTMRAEVARQAVQVGATAVNDVSGGLADPSMLPVVAELGVSYFAMHWRGHATRMQELATYVDVVADTRAELAQRVAAALEAGIPSNRIAIDPGIGFAKTAEHNWSVLAHLESLRELGHPVLVGGSRKTFLGALLARADGAPRSVERRDPATAALSALCAIAGAWCVRVHDVAGSLDAVKVAARWAQAETT